MAPFIPVLMRLLCEHALGSEAISRGALPTFRDFQLLLSCTASGHNTRPRCLRANLRRHTEMVRVLHRWICGHAGACSSIADRAGADSALGRIADAETECGEAAARTRGRAFVAAALLRFQRVELHQADGKAALYSSQSGETRAGAESRGVGVE